MSEVELLRRCGSLAKAALRLAAIPALRKKGPLLRHPGNCLVWLQENHPRSGTAALIAWEHVVGERLEAERLIESANTILEDLVISEE